MTNVDPGTGRSPYAARKHDHHNPLAGGKVVPSKALTAAGEPSRETFLRGDDTWAAVPAASPLAPAGGASGSAGYSTSHAYDIPLGTTTSIDTGWTPTFSEANGGLSLVSGIPTYAPGLYFTTIQIELGWGSDGHEAELHTVQLQEAVVGSVIQVVNGNPAFFWQWSGWDWFTDPATPCGLTLQYHAGPSASASDLSVSRVYFATLRLGDMP